jgi:polyisoprenoid-binding protein YceI
MTPESYRCRDLAGYHAQPGVLNPPVWLTRTSSRAPFRCWLARRAKELFMTSHWTRALIGSGVLLLVAGPKAQSREDFQIQPGTSVTVRVDKGGVFSFAGHEHEVIAPAIEAQIALDRVDLTRSSVRLVFDAAAMKVTGKGEPAADVPEVQRVMLSDRVLDVRRYPTIVFESRSISRSSSSGPVVTLRIEGDLTLHGVVRRVNLQGVQLRLTADRLTAEGKAEIRQSEFGMPPVTAGGGTVRVKDEVTIVFAIVAVRA